MFLLHISSTSLLSLMKVFSVNKLCPANVQWFREEAEHQPARQPEGWWLRPPRGVITFGVSIQPMPPFLRASPASFPRVAPGVTITLSAHRWWAQTLLTQAETTRFFSRAPRMGTQAFWSVTTGPGTRTAYNGGQAWSFPLCALRGRKNWDVDKGDWNSVREKKQRWETRSPLRKKRDVAKE